MPNVVLARFPGVEFGPLPNRPVDPFELKGASLEEKTEFVVDLPNRLGVEGILLLLLFANMLLDDLFPKRELPVEVALVLF